MHLALRGAVEHSPEEVALTLLNNLAYAVGQRALWEHGYYAGTFSEYDMDAIRTFAARKDATDDPEGGAAPAS